MIIKLMLYIAKKKKKKKKDFEETFITLPRI